MTLITDASKYSNLQAAMDAASDFVYVPAGIWNTTSLVCKSGVSVRLSRGAIIKGDVELTNYMTFSGGLVQGIITCTSPCVGAVVRDVRLFGSVVLDVNRSYINNNVFENLWIFKGGVIVNAHGGTQPADGQVTGNVFRIFQQPDETSRHVFEMYGFAESNDIWACCMDWANVERGMALIMDEHTYYNRVYLSGNLTALHVDNRGLQNAVTVVR